MNLNALDLNLIKVFDALLRERSVTRAGEQIGLSQPAVSAALNRLRYILNDQLFVRRGNEMMPTPRAESLAEPLRAALREIERVFQSSRNFEPAELDRTFTLMARRAATKSLTWRIACSRETLPGSRPSRSQSPSISAVTPSAISSASPGKARPCRPDNKFERIRACSTFWIRASFSSRGTSAHSESQA